jgi:hypothetical protein
MTSLTHNKSVLLGKTCFNLFAESYDMIAESGFASGHHCIIILTKNSGVNKPYEYNQKTYRSGLNIKQIQETFTISRTTYSITIMVSVDLTPFSFLSFQVIVSLTFSIVSAST